MNDHELLIEAYRRHRRTPDVTSTLLAETAAHIAGFEREADPARFERLRRHAARLLKSWFEDGVRPPPEAA